MTKERAGSLIFLVLGIYGLALSLQLPMGTWSEPGAAAFPLLVSVLLCLSGILMFITGGGDTVADLRAVIREQKTPAQIVLLTALFIAGLNRLGYLITASLYLFLLLSWVSRYKLWIAAGLAVTLGVVSWYVFGRLLETPLPQGLLPF